MLKKQYERFCQAWQNEKRYQQFILASGQQLEEGHQPLGRKPTFQMWLQAVNNKKISAEVHQPPPMAEEQNEKAVEVQDTDWE